MKGNAGRNPLRNDRGDISIFTCFFVVGIVMLVSFLLLYASIRITCINIRNGAKMELNNLSASIYADTYRSQRETNFSEYLNTLYSSGDYTAMLEDMVTDGLASKIPLSTDDYRVRDIRLAFHVTGDRVEYVFNLQRGVLCLHVRPLLPRHHPARGADRLPQHEILVCRTTGSS